MIKSNKKLTKNLEERKKARIFAPSNKKCWKKDFEKTQTIQVTI